MAQTAKQKRLTLVKQADRAVASEFRRSKALRIVAVIAILAVAGLFFAALFGPTLPYKVASQAQASLTSADFLRQLEAQTDSKISLRNGIRAFANGENFYEAELAAIRNARHSVNIEAYIFHRGEIARRFVKALAERARAGVKVNVVLDALGSASTTKGFFHELTEAGGRVKWYHSLRWHNWMRTNNRTHREILIIDGAIGFVGGAGVADWWAIPKKSEPRWRDDMFRVDGDAVTSLQGTFVENWVEASGEVLSGPQYFPDPTPGGSTPAMVVNSTPSSGTSTRARILFQTLLASARKSLYITTPYFIPDESAIEEMVRAMRERGVEVKILVPGPRTDHKLVRASSRSQYGDLLKAGARIYEYEPAMIHAKVLIVDGTWVVVGSTNFDNRSFGLNDEVNLAALDPQLAAQLIDLFQHDIAESKEVSYDQWQKRGPVERIAALLGWIFERQQ